VADLTFSGYNVRVQRRALRILVLLAAVAGLLALPGAVAQAAFPGTNGLIAFERGADIYTLTTDGSNTVNLLVAGASDPAWSPDGDQLAFVQGGSIKVLTIGGSTSAALDTGTSPSWSPDGTLLVYEKSSDIWVIAASGGAARMLASSGSASDDDPAWSPVDDLIAFTRTDGDADINLMTAPDSVTSGGGVIQPALTNNAANDADPSWTYDGEAIAFATDRHGVKQVYRIVATGAPGSESRLTNTLTDDAEPAYSPEGDDVAFSRAGSGIVTIGSSVTSGVATDANPDWQPVSSSTPASSAPVNTVPPRVIIFGSTGIPVVGVTVSSSLGTWTGGSLTFTYQWKKCQPKDGPCFRILTPVANSSTFLPTGDLIGWSLRVEITAKNSFGETTAQSESTPLVIGNPPVNTVRPRISVATTNPTVGQQLTVDNGSWSGLSPIAYSFQWRRCDPPGTLPSCVPIAGAVTNSYTLTESDLGVTVRVFVTATNAGGATTVFTDHTFPTIPAPRLAPSTTAAPAITGDAEIGGTLTATRGTWAGFAPIRYVSVWQRCDATVTVCRAVKGVKGLVYKVTLADLGWRIRLSVVAVNAIGSLRARSDATEPIVLGQPKPPGRRIVGSNSAEYIPGGGGDDVLLGRGGHDTIMGGKGDDRISGGDGNDYIDGGLGLDRIDGGAGSDTILVADGKKDTVDCGDGNDRVVADAIDVLTNCEARTTPATPAPPGP
jgi:RTX calcium-binding nonapeptide repeat (4 copies)/WD40-like Beta Propeller Repeat